MAGPKVSIIKRFHCSVFLPFNANTQLSLHSQTEGVQRLFIDHTLSISTSVHARNWPWGWVLLIVLPKVVAQWTEDTGNGDHANTWRGGLPTAASKIPMFIPVRDQSGQSENLQESCLGMSYSPFAVFIYYLVAIGTHLMGGA